MFFKDLQDLLKAALGEDGFPVMNLPSCGYGWRRVLLLTCTLLRCASPGLQGELFVQQQLGGRLPSLSFSNLEPTKSV